MKKIVLVVLIIAMLFSMTACGNSIKQTESKQDTREQRENSVIDSDRESVVDVSESESNTETEILENMTEEIETTSSILIAYFSRVGNMNFDENIDAVTSASVNMNGSNVTGNAQMLAEMAQEVTGGDLFFIETVEKYPAEYRGTTDQAKEEQNNDARPELLSHVENMDAYQYYHTDLSQLVGNASTASDYFFRGI